MFSLKINLLFATILFALLGIFSFVSAQELIPDQQETVRAQVLEIESEQTETLPGTDALGTTQSLRVKILEGTEEGKILIVEDDYITLEEDEVFYLTHTWNTVDGQNYYTVSEPYRLNSLYFFITLLIFLVIIFGGIQGLRGLIALSGSFLVIFYILIPGILHGYSPVGISIGVASLIVILGSYITHGFNKTTSSAVLGMITTIFITGALAYIAVHVTRLTGFGSEEANYLNLNTRGAIDLVGLLLGGILIGLLGVLYDAAIGQAVTVEELHRAGPHLPRKIIYKRALRVGREHIGALVNTLALAYVGASLPLILLFAHSSQEGVSIALNREIFSAEIIRIIIGSIGLVLAVPITTLISTRILVRKTEATSPEKIKEELSNIEKTSSHSH